MKKRLPNVFIALTFASAIFVGLPQSFSERDHPAPQEQQIALSNNAGPIIHV